VPRFSLVSITRGSSVCTVTPRVGEPFAFIFVMDITMPCFPTRSVGSIAGWRPRRM
jgi:hypothetical protein